MLPSRCWPLVLLIAGCDPYAAWPDPRDTFPWGVVDDQELEDWERVRWEEGPWDPETEPLYNGMYLQKALFHRKGTPTEAVYHWGLMRARLPPLTGDGIRLSLVGDVLPTGDPPTDPTGALPLLDGHLRVGNLETPVAPSVQVGEGPPGVPRFNAPLQLLDQLPLDLVQVTNNHSLDAGDAGLEETIALLAERGVPGIGVDGSWAAVDLGGGDLLAFLAYTWGVNDPEATSIHDLGIVPFGQPGRVPLDRVRDDIAAIRAEGASLVVVMVHWGYEYEYHPDPHFLKIGRGLVEAGADLVVGSGPHTPQPAEWCTVNVPASPPGVGSCSVRTADGRARYAAILYSLGNFGTDQPTLPLQVGLVAQVELAPDVGVIGMGWQAVAALPGDQPQQLAPLGDLLDDEAYAAESARLDAHLGARWRR